LKLYLRLVKVNEFYSTPFSGQKNYLNTKLNLLKSISLRIGFHSFTFKFTLPNNLPTSFKNIAGVLNGFEKNPFANCNYVIDLFLETTSFGTVKISKEFYVGLNLSLFNELTKPIEIKCSKRIFFSFGGSVCVNFKLEKIGFSIDEPINCMITIDNKSNRTIERSRIKLVQYVIYKATNKYYFQDLENDYRNGILKKNLIIKKILDDQKIVKYKQTKLLACIKLPKDIWTSSGEFNHLITVEYCLIFSFGVFGSFNKHLEIPIVLPFKKLMTHRGLVSEYKQKLFFIT